MTSATAGITTAHSAQTGLSSEKSAATSLARTHSAQTGLVLSDSPAWERNGLLTNLIGYWAGNEASGNLVDAHTNGLDLTDNNTVDSDTGLVYPTARSFTRANQEYFERADEALISTGDIDFTWAFWIRLNSYLYMRPVEKWAPGAHDYVVEHEVPANKFKMAVGSGGVAVGTVTSTTAISLATWYLVVAWHDAANDMVYIQVNDGTVDSDSTNAPAGDAGNALHLSGSAAWGCLDGRCGPWMFWKGILTATQRTALYNGGAGLQYSGFTA